MKNELMIFENPTFGKIRTITEKDTVLFCAKDVAQALGYKDTTNAVKQHCRGVVKRHLLSEGGKQMANFIPEGDIYRLAASSQLPGAEKFESWIFDEVLPSIRKTGSYTAKPMTDYQQKMIETRERNSRIQASRLLTQLAKQYSGTSYEQVLNAHATKELTGQYLLPLPKMQAATYTAAQIGDMLGVSAAKVGQLANRHKLKTEQFGGFFNDMARNCPGKEVTTFRYYETVVPVLRKLMEAE